MNLTKRNCLPVEDSGAGGGGVGMGLGGAGGVGGGAGGAAIALGSTSVKLRAAGQNITDEQSHPCVIHIGFHFA